MRTLWTVLFLAVCLPAQDPTPDKAALQKQVMQLFQERIALEEEGLEFLTMASQLAQAEFSAGRGSIDNVGRAESALAIQRVRILDLNIAKMRKQADFDGGQLPFDEVRKALERRIELLEGARKITRRHAESVQELFNAGRVRALDLSEAHSQGRKIRAGILETRQGLVELALEQLETEKGR